MGSTGTMGFVGGLLQGLGTARSRKLDREDKKETNALTKQLLQIQLQNAKNKSGDNDLARDFIKLRMALQQGKEQQKTQTSKPDEFDPLARGETAPVEQSTPMGESFTSEMAKKGMVQDPMIGAALKKLTGIDFLGAMGEERRAGTAQWKKGMDIQNFNLKLQERLPGVNITTPEGTTTIFPSKYGTQEPLKFATKPSAGEMPIKEASLPLWIHPEDLGNPQFGMTPAQASKNGFKRISAGNLTKINDFRGIVVLLNKMEDLMGNVFPAEGGATERITGGIPRSIGAALQTNPDAALLKNIIDGTLAALIRMYEKGTLTDKDIARARQLTISLTDSSDLAWKQLSELKDFVNTTMKSFLTGVGSKNTKTKKKNIIDEMDKALQ
jgi:hypothetical protein